MTPNKWDNAFAPFQETIKNSLITMQNEISLFISEFINTEKAFELSKINACIKQLAPILSETLVERFITLGNCLWCIWTFEEEDLFTDEFINSIELAHQLKIIYETNDIEAIKAADEFVLSLMQQTEIEYIQEYISNNLRERDAIRFQHAMDDYKARRFYQCANVLCGLIDCQNIKRNHGKWKTCGEHINNEGTPIDYPIKQARKAFLVIFERELFNTLPDESDQEKISNLGTKQNEKDIKSYINKVKNSNVKDFEKSLRIILLYYCMEVFFKKYEWTNYPNEKPKVINRHCLMHGMYDYDEIKETDCIKLILLLRHTISLYNSLDTTNKET